MAIVNWMKNKKGLQQSVSSFLQWKSFDQLTWYWYVATLIKDSYSVPNLDNNFQNAILKKKGLEHFILGALYQWSVFQNQQAALISPTPPPQWFNPDS